MLVEQELVERSRALARAAELAMTTGMKLDGVLLALEGVPDGQKPTDPSSPDRQAAVERKCSGEESE